MRPVIKSPLQCTKSRREPPPHWPMGPWPVPLLPQVMLERDVNTTALRSDLNTLGAFLDAAPSPASMSALLSQLNATLDGSVRPALADLLYLTAPAHVGGELALLEAALSEVAGFNALYSSINGSLHSYLGALQAVVATPP